MPIPAPTVGSYPSIEQVMELVRILAINPDDGPTTTLGETRTYTDPWNLSINFLNLALQSLQRDLENYGLPSTREVVFIVNGLTPINGPLGLGIPDPTVQVYLSFNGYWDGSVLHGSPVLPPDLLVPIEIKQRQTNSGTVFGEIPNAVNGLPSVIQNYLLGWWTWQQDRIYFNGSQNTMDIELRYTGGVPQYSINLNPDLFGSTLIPFLDSGDTIAYKYAAIYLASKNPVLAAAMDDNYRSCMLKMVNRWIKTAQRTPVTRGGFGDDGGPGASGGGWGAGGW